MQSKVSMNEFGKFLLKMSNFSIFFPSGKKIMLGQVKKYPGQRRVGLLFTAGQKYAQVRSGQGPSLVCDNLSNWQFELHTQVNQHLE